MLRLFGAPHLSEAGQAITGLPAKASALLALLILAHEGAAARSALAARLWESSAPAQANGSLRMLLGAIRKLERATGIRLLVGDAALAWRDDSCAPNDLEEFLRIRDVTREADLDRLCDLYRGPLLAGIEFPREPELNHWIEAQRTLLRDRFVSLVLPAAQRLGGIASGRALRRALDEVPYDDAAERALLVHLARETSPDAVRGEFDSFQRRLETDLQISPELETMALVAQLVPRHGATVRGGPDQRPAQPFEITAAAFQPGNMQAATAPMPSGVPRVLLLPPTAGPYPVKRVQELLAMSLIDDVTITLCRLRSFAILAPHTARQLAAGNPFADLSSYGAEFVLSTRLLPGYGDTELRLGLSFTRISTHEVLFGDELRFAADELPQRHAELAAVIAGKVASNVERAELATFRRTGAASAYVHYLLGQEHLRVVELQDIRKARKSFRRAAELKPDFAPALSMMARTLTLEWLLLGRKERDLLVEAGALARRAVDIDPLEAAGHRELGHVALYMHDLDQSLDHLGTARSRAPHHADILMNEADALIHNSRPADAKPLVEQALSLNPLPPDEYHWIAATLHFFQGRYAPALETIDRMQNPEPLMRLASACSALLGDMGKATLYRERIMARQPDFRIADWKDLMPLRDEEMKDRFVDALKLAGFP